MKKFIYIVLLLVSTGLMAQQPKSAKVIVGTEQTVDPTVNITSLVTDNITETSFRVSWSLSPSATGQIEFYKTDTPATLYYTNLAAGYDPNHIQTAGQQLGGSNYNGTQLTAGTSYTYRVIGESEFDGAYTSDWAVVTTTADLPNLTVTASDATASEPSNDGEFTITSDVAVVGDLPFTYTISGSGENGTDFATLSGTATILNGQTSVTIPVDITDDSDIEGSETASITITSSATYNAGSPNSATVNISDDDGGGSDPAATITATDGSATESGTTTGEFTVTLDAASSGTTTVNYTVGGTATSGSDYTALSGSVAITNGNTTATITVTPINDVVVESQESVIATLASGSGYTIGSPNSATVNIISEDSGGGALSASVSATNATTAETGMSAGEFTISLSEANSGGSKTVNYHMEGVAVEGTDYTSTSGTVTFANGEQTKTVAITAINDGNVEPNKEAVMLIIDDGTGYSHDKYDRAWLDIVDDDNTSSSYPTPSGTVNITNLSDFTNASNAGKTATITGSFSASSATAAANMVLVSGGGIITGSNINLNGSGISPSSGQIFATSSSLNAIYDKSRISINVFGATSGDSTDDNAAIVTAINNAQHLTATLNGSYIKNNHTNFTRSGLVDWDMNGASVEVTSTVNFNMTKVSVDAVFDFTNISPFIYNGEFDGNDMYGRFFYMHGQQNMSFRNLHIHDLYSPNAIRCVTFRFTVNVASSGLDYVEFRDNLIEDVVAQGDGNFNDTFGIAKGFWWTLSGVSNSTDFNAVYSGNTMRNIIGDDAEGFYAIGGASATTTNGFIFDNEDYRYCTRRAIKACVNSVEIRDSYFEEIPESMFNVAQQMGSMLDFFSTSSGSNINDIRVYNNTIRTVPGNNSHYYLLSMTEVSDMIVEDNIITMENLHTYSGIRLGSNTSTYNGDLLNVIIRNNTLNNCYVQAMQNYNPNNTLDINSNTFNFTSTLGYQVAAFRFYGSGTKGNVDFVDNNININMSSANGVNGVISADPAVTGVVNFNVDNATVTYSNATTTRPFGYIQGNFNNTNTIQNSTLVGDSGTNAVVVTGTGGVVITNSFGDGSTAITEQ